MSIISKIRNDLRNGTPGPWNVRDCESYGERSLNFYQEIWNDDVDILVTSEVTRAHNDGGAANMRRIARVPDMEAALLAAEELADAWQNGLGFWMSAALDDENVCAEMKADIADLFAKFTAYRRATGEE